MARPGVEDGGGDLQKCKVFSNALNKQSLTAEKGWSSRLEVAEGRTSPQPKKDCYDITQSLGIGELL
jgi:hypothetical protein